MTERPFSVKLRDDSCLFDIEDLDPYGDFEFYDEALAAAMALVDQQLNEHLPQAHNAEDLYRCFADYGHDPVILGPPGTPRFTAWEYAKRRSAELWADRSKDQEPVDQGPSLPDETHATNPPFDFKAWTEKLGKALVSNLNENVLREHAEMTAMNEAKEIARAWVARQIVLTPTPWPMGTYGDFGPPDDYFVFAYVSPKDKLMLGGSHYVAVHKRSGTIHDLGRVGE